MSKIKLILLSTIFVLMAACGSQDIPDPDPSEDTIGAEDGANTDGMGGSGLGGGHADERGSREYNIGLGERRAQAVRRVLLLQGAQPSQISTVSFGEERPMAFGSDEEAWSQNRRVEFKYTN